MRGVRRSAFAALAAASALLSGCAVVVVHTDGHPVNVSFGLGVPRVDRGENDAIAIRRISVGLYAACRSAGVGLQSCAEYHLDPRSCGIGLVEVDPKHPADRHALAALADRIRAECAHDPKETHDVP